MIDTLRIDHYNTRWLYLVGLMIKPSALQTRLIFLNESVYDLNFGYYLFC